MNENLIDEIQLYTSNNIFDEMNVNNPISIDENWDVVSEKELNNDSLIIARKKILCLQE